MDVAEGSQPWVKGAPKKAVKKKNFLGGPVVQSSPTNAVCMGSNLGWGGKIPHVDSAVRNKHTKAGRDENLVDFTE